MAWSLCCEGEGGAAEGGGGKVVSESPHCLVAQDCSFSVSLSLTLALLGLPLGPSASQAAPCPPNLSFPFPFFIIFSFILSPSSEFEPCMLPVWR